MILFIRLIVMFIYNLLAQWIFFLQGVSRGFQKNYCDNSVIIMTIKGIIVNIKKYIYILIYFLWNLLPNSVRYFFLKVNCGLVLFIVWSTLLRGCISFLIKRFLLLTKLWMFNFFLVSFIPLLFWGVVFFFISPICWKMIVSIVYTFPTLLYYYYYFLYQIDFFFTFLAPDCLQFLCPSWAKIRWTENDNFVDWLYYIQEKHGLPKLTNDDTEGLIKRRDHFRLICRGDDSFNEDRVFFFSIPQWNDLIISSDMINNYISIEKDPICPLLGLQLKLCTFSKEHTILKQIFDLHASALLAVDVLNIDYIKNNIESTSLTEEQLTFLFDQVIGFFNEKKKLNDWLCHANLQADLLYKKKERAEKDLSSPNTRFFFKHLWLILLLILNWFLSNLLLFLDYFLSFLIPQWSLENGALLNFMFENENQTFGRVQKFSNDPKLDEEYKLAFNKAILKVDYLLPPIQKRKSSSINDLQLDRINFDSSKYFLPPTMYLINVPDRGIFNIQDIFQLILHKNKRFLIHVFFEMPIWNISYDPTVNLNNNYFVHMLRVSDEYWIKGLINFKLHIHPLIVMEQWRRISDYTDPAIYSELTKEPFGRLKHANEVCKKIYFKDVFKFLQTFNLKKASREELIFFHCVDHFKHEYEYEIAFCKHENNLFPVTTKRLPYINQFCIAQLRSYTKPTTRNPVTFDNLFGFLVYLEGKLVLERAGTPIFRCNFTNLKFLYTAYIPSLIAKKEFDILTCFDHTYVVTHLFLPWFQGFATTSNDEKKIYPDFLSHLTFCELLCEEWLDPSQIKIFNIRDFWIERVKKLPRLKAYRHNTKFFTDPNSPIFTCPQALFNQACRKLQSYCATHSVWPEHPVFFFDPYFYNGKTNKIKFNIDHFYRIFLSDDDLLRVAKKIQFVRDKNLNPQDLSDFAYYSS
jgi:hypothetical protein